jgi:L-fuculose-phosphate aldolase
LRPVNHEGTLFTPELGRAVATALGHHNALLLQNHGIVVVGTSVEAACVTAVLLEKAARMQLLAGQYGTFTWTPADEAARKKARIYHADAFRLMWSYFLRKLARETRLG